MSFGERWNQIRARAASPLAEVALATAAMLALGAGLLALTGRSTSMGMLWVSAFYGIIGGVALLQRLGHIAFADHLSRDLARVRSASVTLPRSAEARTRRRQGEPVAA